MPAKRRAVRVVSVAAPARRKSKLTPYPKGRTINFWHPEHGMYQGKVVSVDVEKDAYRVELRSGVKWEVKGEWIKTRRPEHGSGG